MPYVKAWFEKLPALATGGVTVTKMRVLGATPTAGAANIHVAKKEKL
jgi:hypothetical protein